MEYYINRLLYLWKYSFYTESILLLVVCIAICMIYNSPNSTPRSLFLIYTITTLFLFISTDVLYCIQGPERFPLWESINILFSVIELFVFYYFYNHLLHTSPLRKLIHVFKYFLPILSILICVIVLNGHRYTVFMVSGYFSVAIYFLLLVPPLLYFFQLLRLNKELDKNISLLSLWLFSYCIITILPTIFEGRFIHTEYTTIYRLAIAMHYLSLTMISIYSIIICKTFQRIVKPESRETLQKVEEFTIQH